MRGYLGLNIASFVSSVSTSCVNYSASGVFLVIRVGVVEKLFRDLKLSEPINPLILATIKQEKMQEAPTQGYWEGSLCRVR